MASATRFLGAAANGPFPPLYNGPLPSRWMIVDYINAKQGGGDGGATGSSDSTAAPAAAGNTAPAADTTSAKQ